MNDILSILRDHGLLLLVGQYPNGPLGGLAITFILSVLGVALAFPLGVVLALARISPFRWLYWPATALVYVMRGVPLLMLIFWVYFFLPALLGRPVSGFSTMLVTLVVYQAAYIAEVVRAGIESLPKGQTEAARAVGLSYMQAMRRVVLPQALYNMVPSMLSQFVSTIKETSLGYVISVNELTFAANQINSSLMTKPFQVFVILAAIYFVLCFTLTQLARYLERRVARRRAGAPAAAAAPSLPIAVPATAE
ncbi:amino acid ABC transporter permease [Variovorax sp. YR216]|uniref:amino acid ABC transporter permease n=1 Tax=Variovorax sp. YR216 TaxID=1882828 RepID=UPI0008951D63|nr:amino acid ABC transporter permease [Variovorax sp. YR216]SEB25020.1 polar amino acid transport system permease protein [Variovorax sp. YR216]